MKVIPYAAWALLSVTVLGAARPKGDYLVIEKTASPDGLYAIAWTLPKGPKLDWEKFRRGELGRGDVPEALYGTNRDIEVENNLIELKSGRKLAKLGSTFWALLDGAHPNHELLEVAWSPKSDFVVVLQHLRFEWGSLGAAQLKNGAVVGQLQFAEDLDAALRARLEKLYPRQYERDEEDIAIAFSDVKPLGGSRFSLTTFAGPPKSIDETRLSDRSLVRFELRAAEKGRLSLHVLGFTKIDKAAPRRANPR